MNTLSLGANSKRVKLLKNSKSTNNSNQSSGPMTTSGPGANSQRIEPQKSNQLPDQISNPSCSHEHAEETIQSQIKSLLLIRVDKGRIERKTNQLT
jgi:hypothetical protein